MVNGLDPFSVVVGFLAAFGLSGLFGAALLLVDWWQARKARDEALDRVLADVAIACLETPTDARVN